MCSNCQPRPIPTNPTQPLFISGIYASTEIQSGERPHEIGSPIELGNRGDNVPKSADRNALKRLGYSRHDTAHDILKALGDNFRDQIEAKRTKRKDKDGKELEGFKSRPALYLCSQFAIANTVDEQVAEKQGMQSAVHVVRNLKGEVRYSGVILCDNPACPICAVHRSAKIRETAVKVGSAVKEKGGHVSFLTLTVQHFKRDKLADLEALLHKATRETFKTEKVRKKLADVLGLLGSEFKSVPTFKIMETTYGRHGWHPHYHIAFYHSNKVEQEKMDELNSFILAEFAKKLEKIRKQMGLEARPVSDKATHFIAVDDDEIEEVTADYCTKEGIDGGFEFELTGEISKNTFASDDGKGVDDEKWLKALNNKLNAHLKGRGLTFVGILDVAEKYKEIFDNAEDEAVKRKAKQKYDEWSALYGEFVLMTFGNRNLNRFSKGLKAFCGVFDEDEEEADEIEESEKIAEAIDVEIPDITWRYVFANKLRASLMKVVGMPEIKQNDVELMISVLERAERNKRPILEIKNWLGRICAERSYQKFGRWEEDLSIEAYHSLIAEKNEQRRAEENERIQAERRAIIEAERLKLAKKFLADKGKRLTARPVLYDFNGETYSRDEFEIEFKAELAQLSNVQMS